MKNIPAVAAILITSLLFFLAVTCSSQNAPEFQSVSGEFARNWIESFKAENPQPVQESNVSTVENNSSNLWNWGGAPRGSRIEDGNLIADPNYIQGIPDLLVLYKDRWAALEVKKSADAKHQPNQDDYVAQMNADSFAAFIYPENEEYILDKLQQHMTKSHISTEVAS